MKSTLKHISLRRVLALILVGTLLMPYGLNLEHSLICKGHHQEMNVAGMKEFYSYESKSKISNLKSQDICSLCDVVFNFTYISAKSSRSTLIKHQVYQDYNTTSTDVITSSKKSIKLLRAPPSQV